METNNKQEAANNWFLLADYKTIQKYHWDIDESHDDFKMRVYLAEHPEPLPCHTQSLDGNRFESQCGDCAGKENVSLIDEPNTVSEAAGENCPYCTGGKYCPHQPAELNKAIEILSAIEYQFSTVGVLQMSNSQRDAYDDVVEFLSKRNKV